MTSYFLRFGRCVSADAAAVFAALLDLGSRRTFAADAARLLVTSVLFVIAFPSQYSGSMKALNAPQKNISRYTGTKILLRHCQLHSHCGAEIPAPTTV